MDGEVLGDLGTCWSEGRQKEASKEEISHTGRRKDGVMYLLSVPFYEFSLVTCGRR